MKLNTSLIGNRATQLTAQRTHIEVAENVSLKALIQYLKKHKLIVTKDCSFGAEQRVFMCRSLLNNRHVIVKVSPEMKSHKAEEIGCLLCKEVAVPGPKVLDNRGCFLMESAIKGKALSTYHDAQDFYSELGRQLRRLHKVPTDGSWHYEAALDIKRNYQFLFQNSMAKIRTSGLFSSSELKMISGYYEKNRDLLNNPKKVHVHGDLSEDNILIHKDRLTIIDWGDLRYAPAAKEFAIPFMGCFEKDRMHCYEALVSAYGELNQEEVNMYVVMKLISKLKPGIAGLEQKKALLLTICYGT